MNPIPAVLKYEGEVISKALKEANKSVTKAAEILGTSRQALSYIIESRHPELLLERSPICRRHSRANPS